MGFRVKNISNKNVNRSVNEIHLKKLKTFLKLSIELKEIKIDHTKNLGKYAFSEPINKIKKNKQLAEAIGIILGDGNIFENALKIAFDKRNKHYFEYVKSLFESLSGIKFKEYNHKTANTSYIYCYNKYLVEALIRFGLKRGNKIKTGVGIPKWIKKNKEYSKKCIKGLIDTDGCIYKCKREKQIYVKFTNCNKNLLKDFKEVTRNLGYSFAKANNKNACLYRKDQVVTFLNEISPLKADGVMV